MQLQGGSVGSKCWTCKSGGWAPHAVSPFLRVFNVFLHHCTRHYLLTARALASALLLAVKIIANVCAKWQMRQGKYYTCGVQIHPYSFWSLITRVFGCVRERGFSSVSLSGWITQANRRGRVNTKLDFRGAGQSPYPNTYPSQTLPPPLVCCVIANAILFAFQALQKLSVMEETSNCIAWFL